MVDANTGKTLFSANADARRYPASLTKMMTLYLTFEALSRGKINKETRVPVLREGSRAKPPTKLGVRAGGSITVETAIYALVTQVGQRRRHRAWRDARRLGSELRPHDDRQGAQPRHERHDLPQRARPARTPASSRPRATWRRSASRCASTSRSTTPISRPARSPIGKQRIANHNRLLGRVKGVDGIKTGYTRASGFNLVSSVTDGNRRIVAVVMGGASGASRDKHMAELIEKYLPQASDGGKGGAAGREGWQHRSSTLSASCSCRSRMLRRPTCAPTPKHWWPRPQTTGRSAGRAVPAGQGRADAGRSPRPDRAGLCRPGAAPAARRSKQPLPPTQVDPVKTASVAAASGWVIQVASSPSDAEAEAILDKTTKQAPGALRQGLAASPCRSRRAA